MNKRFFSIILTVVGTLLPVSKVLASGQVASRLAGSYEAKLHPAGHIKLFMSKPLVYTDPHIWATYLLVMLLLGIATLVLLYKQRVNKEEAEVEALEFSTAPQGELIGKLISKQEALLARIKSLDDEFAAGEIEEQEYWATGEKYKQMLVRVQTQLKELT